MLSSLLKSASKYKVTFNFYRNTNDLTTVKVLNETRNIGNDFTVKGWVKSIRAMKKLFFVDINDGSCNNPIQIVLKKDEKPDNLSWGSSVEVTGTLNLNNNNQLEIQSNCFKVIGGCFSTTGEFPFSSGQTHSPDYIRKYVHLRTRMLSNNAMLRIRHKANLHIHNFFDKLGYNLVNTPILTSNDCEGGGEVFIIRPNNLDLIKVMMKEKAQIDEAYFDKKVFLTVSGQLHLEAAAHGLGNVYTFGPNFRAENSKSLIHLTEFYMLEAERVFTTDLADVMDVLEKLIKSLTNEILNNCPDDFLSLQNNLSHAYWLDKKFLVMTYKEAINILKKQKFATPVDRHTGLTKEQELFLVKHANNVPVFVTEWPEYLKPFYMRRIDNSMNVGAFDLLAPAIGELAGGSLREDRIDLLNSKLPKYHNLDWYLDLRKFGHCPTGGFGMGFERYLKFVLGINNIKDTIPYPRWAHNCPM